MKYVKWKKKYKLRIPIKQPDWAANGGQIEKYMHFNIDYSSLELKYFNM